MFHSSLKNTIVVTMLLFGVAVLTVGMTNCRFRESPKDELIESDDLEQPADLPIAMPDSMIQSLWSLADPTLQAKLDAIVKNNKKLTALKKCNKMSLGLVDLRNVNAVKYASVNGDLMLYAASLPKIAVLLAATDAIEKGELKETDEVKADMRLMIARSNNEASTRMIDRVGFDKIASVMQDPRYELYDPEHGGGLWVGKRYAAEGNRVGEPMKNISHAATATQVCRYYYLLAFGKLVSYDRSRQMLGYLGNPELHHKFVNTLDRVAPSAKVFRKSGSWKTYHSDSALVWGNNNRRYILVALVDDADGEKIMRDLMLEVDKKLTSSK